MVQRVRMRQQGQEQVQLQRHTRLRFMSLPRPAERRRALLSRTLSLAVRWGVFPCLASARLVRLFALL